MAKFPTCRKEGKRSEKFVSRYLIPSHSCPYYLLEGEPTDEGRDAVWVRADCRALLPSPLAVQGDPVGEVVTGSSRRGTSLRLGFEHLAVVGEIIDGAFHELLRGLYPLAIVQSRSKDTRG